MVYQSCHLCTIFLYRYSYVRTSFAPVQYVIQYFPFHVVQQRKRQHTARLYFGEFFFIKYFLEILLFLSLFWLINDYPTDSQANKEPPKAGDESKSSDAATTDAIMPNIHACKPMTDHFEGIDKLVPEAPHTEGAPNFRRVGDCWLGFWLLFLHLPP